MKATPTPFRSNFYLWNGVSAIFFSNFVTNIHSHNTLQILVDMQTGFRCRIDGEDWHEYKNYIIKEEIPHQLDTAGSMQLIIYLDVETTAAKIIKEKYLKAKKAADPDRDIFGAIKPNEWQQAVLRPDPEKLQNIIQQVLQILTAQPETKKTDARIRIIEKHIANTHPDDLSSATLAAIVHLSESRLRALFKEQTGVSMHKYILWTRIRFAINRIMNGAAVNEAAWEAGFTDNSHFHKMLVNMFGISPSQFLRDHRNMEILTCDESPLLFQTKTYDANGNVEKVY